MLIEFGRKGTTFLSNNDAVAMIFLQKLFFLVQFFHLCIYILNLYVNYIFIMTDYHIYTDESYNAPCRALLLYFNHRTMDMSVAGGSKRAQAIIIPENASFPIVSEDLCGCGKTEILGFNPDGNLLVRWHCKEYSLVKGEVLDTVAISLPNPYLSRDEVFMGYEYVDLDNALDAMGYFYEDIKEWQSQSSSLSQYATDLKEIAIGFLWYAVEQGNVGLYPSYALMKSCNNWSSLTITDTEAFVSIMRQGIDSGCFAPQHVDGVYNLSALLGFNKTEEVFALLPELKGIMDGLAQSGNKLAAQIAAYEIECTEKTSRQDPEKRAPVFIICKGDTNGVEYSYDILIGDEIKPSVVVHFDGMDTLEIVETSKEYICFSWCGKKHRIDEEYCYQRTDHGESRLRLKFCHSNLWELLGDLLFQVSFSQVSNNPKKKYRIESLKKCVMKLVEWLIAEGDEKSVELCEALKANENWRCFDLNGELRHMLNR